VSGAEDLLAGWLQRSRFEVIPIDGIEDEVVRHLPTERRVTVSASPTRGLEPTLALCERLAAHGYSVVPHIAARLVADRAHLRDVLDRMRDVGLREAFVIAGDASQPAGEFEGAAALLIAMAELGHGLEQIGISGYPESHAFISDEDTIQAMFEKEPLATYIVSQIAFDAEVIGTWVRNVRARGVRLPIYIGVPGPIAARKLLRISTRIGLGESARFLRRHHSWLGRLLRPRGYRADRLLGQLAPQLADPASAIAGLHLYTFNEVERAERWREEALARRRPRAAAIE
jgi:methylenetetrahydrofolate reductase (NADPH)